MESRILAVRKETHDTVTLRIAAPFTYQPGQFAMVGVTLGGKEVRRSYSITNVHNGEHIELVVKKQNPGLFSEHAQTMQAGDAINVYGPFGHHFLFDTSHKDVVFIAGGSGISPFRCMLQAAAASGYTGSITLLYSVKTSTDIIFEKELRSLSEQLPYNLVVTLTRPTESDMKEWKGKFGRVTQKLLTDELRENITEKRFYICGPTAMVKDTQLLLERLDVPKEHVKTEKFGMIEG